MVGPLERKGKRKIEKSKRAAKAPPSALIYHRGHGYYSVWTPSLPGGIFAGGKKWKKKKRRKTRDDMDRKKSPKTIIDPDDLFKFGHKGDVDPESGY